MCFVVLPVSYSCHSAWVIFWVKDYQSAMHCWYMQAHGLTANLIVVVVVEATATSAHLQCCQHP